MPIVVESGIPTGPSGPPAAPPSQRERWVWIDKDDSEFELTGFVNGVEVVKGMTGRGMPGLRSRREVVYGQPGEVTRDIQHGIREFTVPIVVMGDSFVDMHNRLHDMV